MKDFKYAVNEESYGIRVMENLELNFRRVRPQELIDEMNDIEKKYAPEFLYIQGKEHNFRSMLRVSIIGTRNPSPTGISQAKKVAEFLVKKKVCVVSGLAKGIDTVAHTTAIQLRGFTVAVLGTPLNRYYPAENELLQRKIAQEHLVVSQFPTHAPVRRENFPLRNRTIALLSHASIIIEAGKTTGTEHQSWEALRLGRPVFIVDSLVQDTSLGWPQKLVEYGAEPLDMNQLETTLGTFLESHKVLVNEFTF